MKILSPGLGAHKAFLSDKRTQEKFCQAIHRVVRPGDVVLDLGTGSGIHAFFACAAGAKRVYAVEASPVIELAKAGAVANGYADRIRFIRGVSHRIGLPEKVDVVVTYMGLKETVGNLADARRRFLKKGGSLIPCAIEFSMVPIEDARQYEEQIDFWTKPRYGLKFNSFRRYVANRPQKAYFEKKNFLAAPRFSASLPLAGPPGDVHWSSRFTLSRSGTFHGIGIWHSYRLSEGVTLSSEPPLSLDRRCWSHLFLPLEAPFPVRQGQEVNVQLDLYWKAAVPGGLLWRWEVEFGKYHLRQSSFRSIPLSKELLQSEN